MTLQPVIIPNEDVFDVSQPGTLYGVLTLMITLYPGSSHG